MFIISILKAIIIELIIIVIKAAAGFMVAMALVPILYSYSLYSHIKYRNYK